MTPVTPPPVTPDDARLTARLLDLAEWAGKFALALGSIKVFLIGIYRPFTEWRREHSARYVRALLKPELDQLGNLIEQEAGCAERMRNILNSMSAVFEELDAFLAIAQDNRDRQDETNELLDQIFHLDRRLDHAREAEIDSLLTMLATRKQVRRRHLDALRETDHPSPSPETE